MNESMNVIYLIEKETENVAVVECIDNVQWHYSMQCSLKSETMSVAKKSFKIFALLPPK